MNNMPDNMEAYERLAAAVIRRAILDYETGLYHKDQVDHRRASWAPVQTAEDAKRFFYSDWFKILSKNIDPDSLIEQIEKNYYRYGKCIPFAQKFDDEDCNYLYC